MPKHKSKKASSPRDPVEVIKTFLKKHPDVAHFIAFRAVSGLYLSDDFVGASLLPQHASCPRHSGADYVDGMLLAIEAGGMKPLIDALYAEQTQEGTDTPCDQ